jgi:hypothetical protein
VGKPDKNIPLGRPGSRGDYNIKMNPKKVGWGELTALLWLRIRDRWRALVNMVMNHRVPQTAGNFLTG